MVKKKKVKKAAKTLSKGKPNPVVTLKLSQQDCIMLVNALWGSDAPARIVRDFTGRIRQAQQESLTVKGG